MCIKGKMRILFYFFFYKNIVEDRVISDEFKLWKKNCSFSYDFVMSRSLEYPSTIVRWFNDAESLPDDPKNCERQTVLFSAKTNNDEENYLLLSSIIMPEYSDSIEKLEEYGTFSLYNGIFLRLICCLINLNLNFIRFSSNFIKNGTLWNSYQCLLYASKGTNYCIS